MPRLDFPAHTVLVTGASSGIGAAFVEALAARGANLVLVARRGDRLEDLARSVRARHGVEATPIVADLASPMAAADLRDQVRRAGVRVTGVINNAGFGTFGKFVDDDPGRLAQEIAVDISAPVEISRAFLPDLLAGGPGFLINVASMAAYAPTPRMAVYGAAKAFVLSFTEALWAETRKTDVVVFAVSPGATQTEFNSVVGTEDATSGATMRSADDVVRTALGHLARRNPGPSVIDGEGNRWSARLLGLLPRRAVAALMERVTDPARRGDGSRS